MGDTDNKAGNGGSGGFDSAGDSGPKNGEALGEYEKIRSYLDPYGTDYMPSTVLPRDTPLRMMTMCGNPIVRKVMKEAAKGRHPLGPALIICIELLVGEDIRSRRKIGELEWNLGVCRKALGLPTIKQPPDAEFKVKDESDGDPD